jgi:hypothetical protein
MPRLSWWKVRQASSKSMHAHVLVLSKCHPCPFVSSHHHYFYMNIARGRLGGRLWTDQTTFSSCVPPPPEKKSSNSNGHVDTPPSSRSPAFPVDLGASWIHGIDHNPLAVLAKQAGVDFCTTSEDVQMLGKNMKPVNAKVDEQMGKLFDDLLDLAADDCWGAPDIVAVKQEGSAMETDPQMAVRWYSSVFCDTSSKMSPSKENGTAIASDSNSTTTSTTLPRRQVEATGVPRHRQTTDRSMDIEIGKAIANHKFREFSKLGEESHRMLLWNTKNVEYALGANISDLSMKYWDSDERHAFEGDHVLLKQGYSAVVQHMLSSLQSAGNDRFQYVLKFPVGKVEYARKSTTQAHYGMDRTGRSRKLVELSDACSVTSQDGKETKYFDFLVCALPLGVLKESVAKAGDVEATDKLSFNPRLPFSKIDSITNVGFGLLNKVYLQFPTPFWRTSNVFDGDDQSLFGNASAKNPHHYMFFDVGKSLGTKENAPAILMSLVSGKEAVACECLSDEEFIEEVMSTLREIFSSTTLPQPIAHRITRWGQDKYSRGSYTFLPPGATDQDFQILQSPINGNGDFLLLEDSETMRLFFAGEHTTSLHPSMAHGAMLSGIRAAKELVSTINSNQREHKDVDRVIPLALFRHKNPDTPLQCSLCHIVGGQVREGSLLAFQKGSRQALVHNNCAENSPEVEVVDGQWKHVIKAVNRGKFLNCSLCRKNGATVGCSWENCYRVLHYSCAEDTGWRFDRDGKGFFCDAHRTFPKEATGSNECDRISLRYYLAKNPTSAILCSFCGLPEDVNDLGELLAFQCQRRQVCVHEKCAKYTTIVDTKVVEENRMENEHRNIFLALDRSKICIKCTNRGATVGCTDQSCDQCFHVQCAINSGWIFEKRGRNFRCETHRNREPTKKAAALESAKSTASNSGIFQHNLLAQFGATPNAPRVEVPSNLDMGGTVLHSPSKAEGEDVEEISDSEDSFNGEDGSGIEVMDVPLSPEVAGAKMLVRVERPAREKLWNVSLKVARLDGSKNSVLMVASCSTGEDSLQEGDTLVSINGTKVGSEELKNLRLILFRLKQEVDLMVEVVRGPSFPREDEAPYR